MGSKSCSPHAPEYSARIRANVTGLIYTAGIIGLVSYIWPTHALEFLTALLSDAMDHDMTGSHSIAPVKCHSSSQLVLRSHIVNKNKNYVVR